MMKITADFKQPSEIEIIAGLDLLIASSLVSLGDEQRCPSNNPDAMDTKIAYLTLKVKKLRKLREDFEDLVSGVLL